MGYRRDEVKAAQSAMERDYAERRRHIDERIAAETRRNGELKHHLYALTADSGLRELLQRVQDALKCLEGQAAARADGNLWRACLLEKVVGADLVDEEGSIIAASGSTVTQATISAAQAKGRIAQLILNMTTPELYQRRERTQPR